SGSILQLTGWNNGIESAGIPILGAFYQLSSTQLKALQTTAVLLVPAPGNATLMYIVKKLTLQYLFNTTAYPIGNADNIFRIEYVGKTTSLAQANATGLVDQTASTVVSVGSNAAGNIAQTNAANLGLEIKLAGTTPALTL